MNGGAHDRASGAFPRVEPPPSTGERSGRRPPPGEGPYAVEHRAKASVDLKRVGGAGGFHWQWMIVVSRTISLAAGIHLWEDRQ